MTSKLRQKAEGSVVAMIGYLLSPLSWWNDLYVNIPIAYVLAWLVGHVDRSLFGPSTVIFYWLTNLVGLLMLHRGVAAVTADGERLYTRKDFLKDLGWSLAYTAVVGLLVYAGLIRLPEDYVK